MAQDIGDDETARIADEFSSRHREKVDILERKLSAQRDELRLAQAEVRSMVDQFREREKTAGVSSGSLGSRSDPKSDSLRREIDSKARESAVAAQLDALKKKMGK